MATKFLTMVQEQPSPLEIEEENTRVADQGPCPAFVEVEIKVPKGTLETVGLNFKNAEAIPETLKAKIPTFVPRNLPKMDSGTLKKFDQLTTKLADWLGDQFPDVIEDEDLLKIAGDTVVYCGVMFPEMDFDSANYFTFLKEINLSQVMDFFIDNPAFEDERKNWMDMDGSGKWNPEFLEFLSWIETVLISGNFEIAGEVAFKLEIVHKSPFLSMFLGASWETLINSRPELRTYMLSTFWKVSRATLLQQDSRRFGEEVFRYARYVDSVTLAFEKFFWEMKRSSSVCKEVLENPFYSGFRRTGERLACAWNDILGLQKDLQTGEYKNMIIFKSLKGANLQEAWDSEIDYFVKTLKSYEEFKERLFTAALTEKEKEELEFLVDLWDSMIFSSVLLGKFSPKYETGDHIRLFGVGVDGTF